MACVDELWLGRPPILLSPAACWGIVEAVLDTQVVVWLMGIGLVSEVEGHNGSAASKRTLFRQILMSHSNRYCEIVIIHVFTTLG